MIVFLIILYNSTDPMRPSHCFCCPSDRPPPKGGRPERGGRPVPRAGTMRIFASYNEVADKHRRRVGCRCWSGLRLLVTVGCGESSWRALFAPLSPPHSKAAEEAEFNHHHHHHNSTRIGNSYSEK